MIALFLLTGVVLVLVTLLHSLLRYGREVEMQSLAALAAEKRLEQLRDWSRQKAGNTYQFENLVATHAGQVTTDPEFPGFTLTTQAQVQPLDMPGSALEQTQTDKQRLTGSAVLIRVVASWGTGRSAVVTSLIGAPARIPNTSLTVTHISGANPVPASGSAIFRASARDSDGQTLPDLSYRWYVLPQTGNASIVLQRRDSSEARLINQVRWPSGTLAPASGTCMVEARAYYRGKELIGVSSPISLLP
jgi:Tfp pilus assembly protein PilV